MLGAAATHLVLCIKGVLPSTALVQPDTQRPHITLLIVWLVFTHLRREVVRGLQAASRHSWVRTCADAASRYFLI